MARNGREARRGPNTATFVGLKERDGIRAERACGMIIYTVDLSYTGRRLTCVQKRLNNANAPVNTLDGPVVSNARNTPRTSFSSPDSAIAGGSKRRIDHDREATYGDRDPKRLRPNGASRDTTRLSQDDASTESVGRSTASNDDRCPKKVTQVRQAEFRSSNAGSPSSRRRRNRKRQSAGARQRRSSEGVHHGSEPPRSVSPDELQNSSPPHVESDLLPSKPAALPKSSRSVCAGPKSLLFDAAKHFRKTVPLEDVSDDELANDASKQGAKARAQSFSNTTKSRTARHGLKIRLHEAVSGLQIFQPEKDVELVRDSSGTAWKLVTEDGKPIGHPWLRLDVERMNKINYSPDSEIAIIHRPQAKHIASMLILQFEHKQASLQFILGVKSADAPIKLEEKSQDFLASVYTRTLETARQNRSGEGPDHPTPGKSPRPETFDCAPSPQAEETQRRTPPRARLIDGLLSGPQRNSTSQRSSSPPSKPPSTPRPHRVTRQSAPGGLLEDYEDPSLPRWSLENTAWEKEWDRELVYPSTGRNRATVHKEDIHRLDEGAFLNDSVVFFYLRYLQVELDRERPDIAKRIYFMNTYFFEILRKAKGGLINYEGVKSWTSKVDIFSYDYIVVPVNEEAHWYLAIICNPRVIIEGNQDTDDDVVLLDSREETRGEPSVSPKTRRKDGTRLHSSPLSSTQSSRALGMGQVGNARKVDSKDFRIITLDSLGAPHSKTCQMLRKYLVEEAKCRKNLDAPELDRKVGLTAKNIPAQNNFCDCGVFLLGYAQNFLKDPDGFVEAISQKRTPEWTVDASELRNRVRETLFRLHREYRKEVAERKKNSRKKKSGEGDQEDSAGGPSDRPVSEAQDQTSPVLGQQGTSPMPRLTGNEDTPSTTAREQAGGSSSVEPDPVNQNAEGQNNGPRTSPPPAAPTGESRAMSSPPAGSQGPNSGSGSIDIRQDVEPWEDTSKIRQSIEHDGDQSASTSHNGSSSPDPPYARDQGDDIVHSPPGDSPPDVATHDAPDLPPTQLKPSIEKPAEPHFVRKLSSSPRSARSAASPVLGERSPSKRKVISVEDDDEPQNTAKRVKETDTKSEFFDGEFKFVGQRQKYDTRGFELKGAPRHGTTPRRGQGRRSSDAIDLTGKDHG